MKEKILMAIKEAEKKHKIKILWAIESGSRAWGFSSKDSDYDVRCMHIGNLDDYLGLETPPQQVNLVRDNIDLESWDIRKFAQLTVKSNPQIAEWLRSPIVYLDSPVRMRLRKFFDKGCSLEFLRQHYLRMSKQNYHKYMGTGMAHSCKKYLYVLRGIACAIYIEKEGKLPPLPYKEVIEYLPEYARRFFERCVTEKQATEKAQIVGDEQVNKLIDRYINQGFGKIEGEFKNKKEMNKYVARVIKR
jgi:uncharacterized protein